MLWLLVGRFKVAGQPSMATILGVIGTKLVGLSNLIIAIVRA